MNHPSLSVVQDYINQYRVDELDEDTMSDIIEHVYEMTIGFTMDNILFTYNDAVVYYRNHNSLDGFEI